jgi:hypothetical protein
MKNLMLMAATLHASASSSIQTSSKLFLNYYLDCKYILLLITRLLPVRCTDYVEYYMHSLISYSKKLEIKNLRKYR